MTAPLAASRRDVIDATLAIEPGSRLDTLRASRPDARGRTQSSYDALFDPVEAGALPSSERFAAAWRVAEISGSQPLAEHYRARLEKERAGDAKDRRAAILSHVELVTREPRKATPADLAALASAGLDEAAIVTLSQIIGFVAYQVRVAATLALMGEIR